jgi:hypothetical protein
MAIEPPPEPSGDMTVRVQCDHCNTVYHFTFTRPDTLLSSEATNLHLLAKDWAVYGYGLRHRCPDCQVTK